VNLTVVVAIAALPTTALLAWALWLLFNVVIARRHGPDSLRITPQIARAFRPQQWARPLGPDPELPAGSGASARGEPPCA
jgi:hypothetical protein